MLKHIDPIISPELIKILMEMGHGDEIVIADGNFPSASHAQKCVRADGHSVASFLRAILTLMPLDTYVNHPIALMLNGPEVEHPEIWGHFEKIVIEENNEYNPEYLERFEFYKRAQNAYAIVATSEKQLYANIILKKGVI